MTTQDDYYPDELAGPFETTWAWKGGAVAGLLSTVVMGVAISLVELSTLQVAIAGLYGQQDNLAVGWVAHLFYGTLFRMIFAVVLANPGLYRVGERVWKSVVAGVVYGLVLAVRVQESSCRSG